MTEHKRVALALGSGGARGYAHIGVIQVLEEHGYEVVAVSGTSMGALVGGLYAAGQLEEYDEWVTGLAARDVWRLLDVSVRGAGIIRGDKVMARVADLLAGAAIEDLRIPYTAVATDLAARKEVWFQHGPVEVAIRASTALPTFLTPVMHQGRLLADGGLMNPVPIAPLTAVPADLVVAVTLDGDDGSHTGGAPEHESAEEPSDEEWRARLRLVAAQVRGTETAQRVAGWLRNARAGGGLPEPDETGSLYDDLPPGLGFIDVMEMSLETLQSVVARYRMASYPPDLLISIPRHACRTLEFHRAHELISLGREIAERTLKDAGP
ncbi:MAG TPA: patatin-like phospholipase family protein [Nocardioides sp.]|nr:patatin-like phospholipase family protein [Nocardioides sp.]